MKSDQNLILSGRGIKKHFNVSAHMFSNSKDVVKAVDDIDFDLYEGKTLGIVGESGSGKTTLLRTIIRMHEPTSGTLFLGAKGDESEIKDFFELSNRELVAPRLRMQYVFQDPYHSLNPKIAVKTLITEPWRIKQRILAQKPRRGKEVELAVRLLEQVGLSTSDLTKYPHEFSGGQRQRISIARALSVNPSILLCDEPVSSLDVSIQSQVLNLLNEIQKKQNLSTIFIAHNLPVVFYVSDEVAVMYKGRIVERGPSQLLSHKARHPYTLSLIDKRENVATGALPNRGCPFAPYCPLVKDHCRVELPKLREISQSHYVACHEV